MAAAGAVRLGNTVGAALGGYRVLGRTEATLLLVPGVALVSIAALAIVLPWLVLAPVIVVLAWLGIALIVDSVKARRESAHPPEAADASGDPPVEPP